MFDAEIVAVGAINEAIAYCPRLSPQIAHNDKTPITDGHIDVYAGIDRKNADLVGRVAVQVKGRSHHNRKIFKKETTSYAVEREVLTFLRDDGGGVYFYVALHPDTRQRRIFYAVLNPFKLNRLIGEMKADQNTKSIPFRVLPGGPAEIEQIVLFALNTKNQNMSLGSDPALLDQRHRFTLYSTGGIDLSRPAVFDLAKTDFAVVVHTEGGLNIPVDVDLEILPSSYIQHERDITVVAGGTSYAKALVTQLDEHRVALDLSPSLRLVLDTSDQSADLSIEVTSAGSVLDELNALDFFVNVSDGQPVVIDGNTYTPATAPNPAPEALLTQRRRLREVTELLEKLQVDAALVQPSALDAQELKTLLAIRRALILGDALHAEDGGAGRFDLNLGGSRATLMAVPGGEDHYWRFFDLFDPANRSQFRIYSVGEEGEVKEIEGTAYEGLEPVDLATTLNLRLEGIVGAYEAVKDKRIAHALANRKVLHLISASDDPQTLQSEDLLAAAQNLNDWLIRKEGDSSPNLINRWQIQSRRSEFTNAERDAVRNFRKSVMRANVDQANVVDACCAILLGDEADIRYCVSTLTDKERADLEGWPIWALHPQTTSEAEAENHRDPIAS
ncbi:MULTISPECIES: hypothetical protein [Microbacterium]|uniref:hypothetical protein n=1 Tax=Microbacterium TaxID=33882 RepID=UPI000D650139|nr:MULTISPECIES: hypothetical protein [Microbacterium]